MANEILLYTTTCPDETFDWDIFSWEEWLQEETLPKLYSTAVSLEACYQFYTQLNKRESTPYQDWEANVEKAHFYHCLVVAVYEEINRRKYPAIHSVNEN